MDIGRSDFYLNKKMLVWNMEGERTKRARSLLRKQKEARPWLAYL